MGTEGRRQPESNTTVAGRATSALPVAKHPRTEAAGIKITQALLGEHGAMYPMLDLIEQTAPCADLSAIGTLVACLQSILGSHAAIEDDLLRPAIQAWLPPPINPTDHQVIAAGLASALASTETEEARCRLLATIAKTRAHFLKEETSIFVIAARELPPEEQEKLGAEWAGLRGVSLAENLLRKLAAMPGHNNEPPTQPDACGTV